VSQIPSLVRVFAYLSLLTVGGGMAAFPELQTLAVTVHHWLTAQQLVNLYGVEQIAPGPRMMMIVSIGQWAGGFAGAVAVLVAFLLPTSVLAFFTGRLWTRVERWPWRTSIQRGLAPVSIGLLLAGFLTVARVAVTGVGPVLITVAVSAVLLRSRANPALVVLGGALVGLVALR
jgi:chromate transporter